MRGRLPSLKITAFFLISIFHAAETFCFAPLSRFHPHNIFCYYFSISFQTTSTVTMISKGLIVSLLLFANLEGSGASSRHRRQAVRLLNILRLLPKKSDTCITAVTKIPLTSPIVVVYFCFLRKSSTFPDLV